MSQTNKPPEDAKIAAAHALFGSGTVAIDTSEGYKMKIHDSFPDAPLSPIYVSLRPQGVKGGRLSPQDFLLISQAMSDVAKAAGLFDNPIWAAGIPAAGEPIVDAMLVTMGDQSENLIRFRMEKVEDAGGRRITGVLQKFRGMVPDDGSAVVLIDDLITKAGTKIEAIEAMQNYGAVVEDMLVFLDRSSDARETLDGLGVNLHTVWDFHHLLNFALDYEYIGQKQFETIIEYPARLQAYINSVSPVT